MNIIKDLLNDIARIVYSLFSLCITISYYILIIPIAVIVGILKGGLNEVIPSIKYIFDKR